MNNYICINGKKAELTEEQLKQLGIEVPKANPFERTRCEDYYFIDDEGEICSSNECLFGVDDVRFEVANYCTDKAIMEQRALHETLNRLLWRYSMEHDGDNIEYLDGVYEIKRAGDEIIAIYTANTMLWRIPFNSRETAENAIKEIVEPFMAEHPEFKW